MKAPLLALCLALLVGCGRARDSGLGARCSHGAQCLSGSCVDGRCTEAGGCGVSPALGCACEVPGALRCNGAAQKLKLVCRDGAWDDAGTCGASESCDQLDGSCKQILPSCAGQAAGFAYCDATGSSPAGYTDVRKTCGPDLVSDATVETCAGICAGGACQAAACGDGKVGPTEECDDGNGTPLDGCEPVCLRSGVIALSGGLTHTCALLRGGYVRCWGGNDRGELGLGHTAFQGNRHPHQLTDAAGAPAGPVDLGAPAEAVGAGDHHSCALLTDASVRCWGDNTHGQLGLGHTGVVWDRTPGSLRADLGQSRAVALAVGGNVSCVILSGGDVRCWGDNTWGQLGLGNTSPVSATMRPAQLGPVSLGAGAAAATLAVGGPVCAVLSAGEVRCWGYNDFGELGIGSTMPVSSSLVPSDYASVAFPPPARSAAAVAVGANHSCALLDIHQVQCWGDGSSGQLGLGNKNNVGDDESPALVGIVPLPTGGASAIAAGAVHTCAVFTRDGGVRCWGDNAHGQLGTGSLASLGGTPLTTPRLLPPVSLGGVASSVHPGALHTCVVLTSGEVRCWGWNAHGQLGLGFVSGVTTGTPDWVGGDAASTPDLLPAVQIFPP